MVSKTIKVRLGRHDIRNEIERRILSGESKPGERLTQQSLARELGVGQGLIRESLFELQWLGLVESIDGLGMFVDKLDVARIFFSIRRFTTMVALMPSFSESSRTVIPSATVISRSMGGGSNASAPRARCCCSAV